MAAPTGGGYSAISGNEASIRYVVEMDSEPVKQGTGLMNKAITKTGDTLKQAGDTGQKAMDKLAASMNKAGGATYDFGSQAFQSMTVLDAVKEGTTGFMEQMMMSMFDPDSQFGDLAALAFGGVGGLIIKEIYDEVSAVDWGKLGDMAGEALGMHTHENFMNGWAAVTNDVQTSFTQMEWAESIHTAMQDEDWATVTNLLQQKLATGEFTELDASILGAIGKSDYTTAADLITTQFKGADYSSIGQALAGDIAEGMAYFWKQSYTSGAGDEVGLFDDESLARWVENADWDAFEAQVKYLLEHGFGDAADAAAWRTNFSEMVGADKLQDELNAAANLFATTMKDPDQYTGLGKVLYDEVKTYLDNH